MSEGFRKVYKKKKVYQDTIAFVSPFGFEAALRVLGMTYDQVTKEETELVYVYKMDKPWLTRKEVAVEIRWGWVLWVLGQGDEAVKVKLPRSDKVKVSAAMAAMSGDGVPTIVAPKRDWPQQWYKYKYKYKDLGLIRFKTVHVPIYG